MAAPTGVVTLVFTDIEGSSALWDRLGRAFEAALALHHRLIRERLAARGGFEVKTEGGSFMAAFASASDAVRFALEAQEALSAARWPEEAGELRVRMGIHSGEPICVPDPATGRMDYFGPVVNRAARISEAAHGGQVLLSDAVRAAARESLAGAAVADLGEHRLRGLERPERLFQALPAVLSARSFPPPRTLTAVPTNLPAQAASFVGRERELVELAGRFGEEGTRLVTITGPAGVGKSRLAARAASDMLERFRGGVWHVEATECTSSAELAHAVARALGVILRAGEPPEKAVADVLEFREPLVLAIDNADQAASAAPATIGAWRSRAPHARFLVTCRSLLGLEGERELSLEPLPVPPRSGEAARRPEVLATCDAVRLFVDRAREADPRFELTAENAPAVATICSELEGLPLAIELAAARVRIMKPQQIVSKLGQRFELLRSARSGVPARQQTLLGAIEWSYALLTEWERAAFEQLCAFRGGFFLGAAEAVLDLSGFPDAPPAMDAVQRLRERSFLRAWETPWETRFGMFASLREFGERRAGERARGAAARHAGHYVAYVEEWSGRMGSAEAREAAARLTAELENSAAAIERLLESGRAEEAGALTRALKRVCARAGRLEAWSEWCAKTLAKLPSGSTALRARLLAEACEAHSVLGATPRAEAAGDEAIAAARACGVGRALCRALEARGSVARVRGDLELADRLLAEARDRHASEGRMDDAAVAGGLLGLAWSNLGRYEAADRILSEAERHLRAAGKPWLLIPVLNNAAIVRHKLGDVRGAIARLEEAERLAREGGDPGLASTHQMNRGRYLLEIGELEQALACYAEAEAVKRREGDKGAIAFVVRSRGNAYRRLGEYDRALKCYAESEGIERALGNRYGLHAQLRSRGHVHMLRGEVSLAAAAYGEALGLAQGLGDEARMLSAGDIGNIEVARGNVAGALKNLDEAVGLARRTSNRNLLPDLLNSLADARILAGDAAGALACVEESDRVAVENGNPLARGASLAIRAELHMTGGRPERACEAAAAALDAFSRSGGLRRVPVFRLRVLLACAESALGHADEARRAAEAAKALAVDLGLSAATEDRGIRECLDRLERILESSEGGPRTAK